MSSGYVHIWILCISLLLACIRSASARPLNMRGKKDVPSESLRYVGKVSPRDKRSLFGQGILKLSTGSKYATWVATLQSTKQTQHSFGS
ncbi:uncharacterized protein B0T23DRAFT_377351 [Neurospora hispaniola]|uniref:Uncharacterized protein n=1 Tax=Neurospora hispaniola TaxID=588809 RepID=A0AAJ0IA39_9PEZI|nr:hypothetical protein B0T23DRAFT_377351 [Neurospora hispaniola]